MHINQIRAMHRQAETLEELGGTLLLIPEIAPTAGELIRQSEALVEFVFEESIYGQFRSLSESYARDKAARDLRIRSLELLHDVALWKARTAAKAKIVSLGRQLSAKGADSADVRIRLSHAKAFLVSLERYRKDFNPDQPRVPAGNPDGGQWTSGGGDGNSSSDGNDSAGVAAMQNGIDNPTQLGDGTEMAAGDGMPGDRARQKQQIDAIQNELGFDDDQRELLHEEVHGQNMGYHEIRARAIQMFGK